MIHKWSPTMRKSLSTSQLQVNFWFKTWRIFEEEIFLVYLVVGTRRSSRWSRRLRRQRRLSWLTSIVVDRSAVSSVDFDPFWWLLLVGYPGFESFEALAGFDQLVDWLVYWQVTQRQFTKRLVGITSLLRFVTHTTKPAGSCPCCFPEDARVKSM